MAEHKFPFKTVTLLTAYLLISLIIVAMASSLTLVDSRIGMIPLTNFNAYKPYQYRVLMPLLIRGIESITPKFIENNVVEVAAPRITAQMEQEAVPDYKAHKISIEVLRVVIYAGLSILSFFLFMLALWKLAGAFDYFPPSLAAILPIGLLLVMPLYFDYGTFAYDFPHLLLFTLGLYFLAKGKWPSYLVIFALGIINKETAIALTLIFAVYYYRKLPRHVFFYLLGGQLLIFLAIKLTLYFVFYSNPGVFAEWHLSRNFSYLADLSHYFRFEKLGKGIFMPFALQIPWPRGLNIPVLALVSGLMIYGWREKPDFLRKATVYFIILFLLAITYGFVNELRAYYDALPIVYLLAAMGGYKLYKELRQSFAKGYSHG